MELAKLEIYMLGNLKILLNNQPITDQMSNKAIGILCYLVFHKGKPVSRDKLASFFWDSSNIEAARYNLRYNLWSLRKNLMDDNDEYEFIVTHKDRCKLNLDCSDIYVDVFEMEDILKANQQKEDSNSLIQLEKIKNIYRGDFLEGFYIKNCPEWNDWIFFERERFQRKYFEVLHQLTSIYKNNEKYFKSIEILEEMLRCNPLQEELYVELIKIYLELGDRNAALNQYKRCCNVLRQELNVGPMDSTKKIYEEIQKNDKPHETRFQETERDLPYDKSVTIQLIEKDKMRKLIRESKETHHQTTLFTECYPVQELSYYWVSNLLREIIKTFDGKKLKEIPLYYWKDLLRIDLSVLNLFEVMDPYYQLTPETEKNRIFHGLEQLLSHISDEQPLSILIHEFQWIDENSFQFIKYFLFRNKEAKVAIVIAGDPNDGKVEELKKYFRLREI